MSRDLTATYGGHLELSAFAHMYRRNVKVIQPGLVYVIEWDAGGNPSSDEEDKPTTRARRNVLASSSTRTGDDDIPETVYVA